MPRGKAALDRMTLQMALAGYEIERNKIEEKIRALRAQLKGKSAAPAAAPAARTHGRRKMSAAARARIAAAQKKRWAEFHKRNAESKG